MTCYRLLIVALCLFVPVSGFCGENFEAFLQPNKVVDMASSYRDRLAVLHVKEGEQVQTGQLLAEFDSRVLQSRIELATMAAGFHGNIDSAKALVKLRKSKLVALQKLHKSGNAKPQELDAVRTNLVMAKAQLLDVEEERKFKEAELNVIYSQLEEKKIRSPLDGVVLKIYKQEAELVGGSSDQESILTLVQLDPLLAVFHVASTAISSIRVGETGLLSVEGKPVHAEVDFISPVIEAQSGTVTIRFRLPNPDNEFVSGSRVIFSPLEQEILKNESTGKEQAAGQGQIH